LIFALPTLLLMKGKDREVGVFAIVMAGSYLCVISPSKTKLEWYLAPVFPFLSLFFVVAPRTLISWAETQGAMDAPSCDRAHLRSSSVVRRLDGDRGRPAERPGGLLGGTLRPAAESFREAFPNATSVFLGTPDYQGPALYYLRYFAERGLRIERERLDSLALRPGDTILTSVEEISSDSTTTTRRS
jgi:hypothetical protein